ncbi:MAG: cation diffusion facilitator family transporter [Tannerellaceae bacterium]|nr:cation diffusion facilitator family transporter [Tannerellaceae bacterium]
MDEHIKKKVLLRTSWISTIGNTVLSLAKIVVGIFSGSVAVLGDGIDSATDVIISLVMIFTARIMTRPPSQKYVYGYEKAESIATKILSMVIFYVGLQMLFSTMQSLFSDAPKELPATIAIYVTVFSIVGKLGLAWYQYHQGERVSSSLLIANAQNMRNDVIISVGVLAGLVFTFVFKLPVLDTITGLIVSLFIIKSFVSIFMESNVELMDGVNDVSVYQKISEAVEKVPGASNSHRVCSRQIGGLYMIVLDIEADEEITLNEAHAIAEEVEDSIQGTVENVYDIVVHVEPAGKHHDAEKFGVDKHMLS